MQGRSGPDGRLVRKEAVSDTPDIDLVAKAQAGDVPAFGHLVRRHAPIAKRMAMLWGAGPDADDVVQEAFVKAYAALPRFRGDGFRAWLLSIVHNETRNLHRSRGRRVAREAMASVPEEFLTFDPEEEAMSADRRRRLLSGVRQLPVPLREVVSCRYLLELSETETALALGLPAGTVKSRLHRALTNLRKEVGDG
jgi:RNA polymerase sigma factor (sigma-70 family)